MAVNEIKLLELSLENKIINGIDKKSRDNSIKEIREKLDDYGKYEKIAVFYSNKINTLSKLKSDSTTFLGFAVRSKWVYTTNDNVQENLELFHLVTKDFKIMSTPQVEFIEEP